MSVVRNIDNIKYFAPIAISRLYEKQQYFNCNIGQDSILTNTVSYQQRRIHSEKQFKKMQKMMFAKNKDGDYTTAKSQAQAQQQQQQQQQAQWQQQAQQQQQKELQ